MTKEHDRIMKPNLIRWKKRKTTTPLLHDEVSIMKGGRIGLSDHFIREHFADGWVEIHYDPECKVIALKPEKNDANAYKIVRTQGRRTKNIFAPKKLLFTLQIKPIRYKAKWSDQLGMLTFTYEVI